jgi:hypothetical protein
MAFQLQNLALAAQVKGHEMAQALEGNLALELQFERGRPAAIGAGELADLHHHITTLGPGVNQLAAHGKIVVALGHRIGAGASELGELGELASGFSRGVASGISFRKARIQSTRLGGASPILLGIAGPGAGFA